MIGYKIEATDLGGVQCRGIIHDKVSVLQSIMAPASANNINQRQMAFFPLDAYLIVDSLTGVIHFVAPGQIKKIIALEKA